MYIVHEGVVVTIDKTVFPRREFDFILETIKYGNDVERKYYLEFDIQYNTHVKRICMLINSNEIYAIKKNGMPHRMEITNQQYNEILTIIEDFMDMSIDDLTDGKMGFLEEQDDEKSFEDEAENV